MKDKEKEILIDLKNIYNVTKIKSFDVMNWVIKAYEYKVEKDESDFENYIMNHSEVFKILALPDMMLSLIFMLKMYIRKSDNIERLGINIEYASRLATECSKRDEAVSFCKSIAKVLLTNGVMLDSTCEISTETLEKLGDLYKNSIEIEFENSIEDDEIEYEEDSEDDDFQFDSTYTNDEDEIDEDNNEEPIIVEDAVADRIEYLEELKEVWGEKLEYVIDGIMASYRSLYESGYGLTSPAGILTNVGIIRSTTDGRITSNGNKAVDMGVFNIINKALNNKFGLYAQNGAEPDIMQLRDIARSNKCIIYTDMHLKFMYGHLNFCTGENSVRKYLTENNIKNGSTTKVLKYSSISGWIRKTLENYFYDAYEKCGITSKASQDEIQTVNEINELLSKNLKNVIAVVERKSGVNTRIRICTDDKIDVDKLISEMKIELNTGTSKMINVKQIGSYENGVVDLNVIYNNKKYSQDSLFAYQVLDVLDEQGIKPSWDNVILGKREDGTIMTYNFKDKTNPVYGLYASSRSGKGVMTLNLIASALADNCKLLYVDGKPDMGSVLADVAWKDNLDCAVYNGVSGKGSETLENRGTCIRSENPSMSINNIPDGVFITEAEKNRFMLITTYLKGIELICEVAASRASQKLDTSDWVVAFVDECEQASVAEIEVMNSLDRAEANRKATKGEDGKKIDLTKDEAYKFIQNYRSWLSILKSNFKTCVTSTFGFANMTTFFIWQSTKFPEKYKNASALASVVDSASGNITKIVGRGAAVNYGSSVFGTPSSLKDATWYDDRFSGKNGGYFAIGKNVQSNNMIVFRPFNVYSDSNNKQLILENAKANGLTQEDLIGVSLNRDGSVIKEIGFEGYVNKLLSKYNLTASQQLHNGFAYFNDEVVKLGLGESLNEFMYNTCRLMKTDDNIESENSEIGEYPDLEFSNNDRKKESNSMFAEEPSIDSDDADMNMEFSDFERADNRTIENGKKISKELDNYNKAYEASREALRQSEEIGVASPEIEATYGDISINIDEKGDYVVKNRKGLDIIDLDMNNFVDVDDVQVDKQNKLFNKMKGSNNAINYNMENRWRLVLDSISRAFSSDNLVSRINIMSNGITVNGRIININRLLDDGNGIELEDIVRFEMTLNRFKFVRELTLDSISFNWMVREYGVDKSKILQVFAKHNALNRIVVNLSDGSRPVVIDRNNLGKSADKVQSMADEAELRQQIEQMAASYNPNVHKKGDVYMNRVVNANYGFTKSSWGKVKNNLFTSGKKHPIRGMFWIGASAITGIIGTTFLAGSKLMGEFRK